MLGDITPQSVRIAQNAVVYPGRNHVVTLTVKRYDGRSYKPVDLDDLTRVVLVFPDTNPTIAFDSATDSVFTWAGNVLTIDLSDYAMPESIEPSHLIVFDAQHLQGQVLVDNLDSRLEFDFRLISTTGALPPPTVEFITDAPQDGETYGRKDGAWVTLEALVSGVVSVNGKTGTVVLDAADVGAATTAQGALADSAVQPGDLAAVATSGSYTDLSDTPTLGTAAAADTSDFDQAGAATTAVSTHVADTTPHETLLGVDRVGFDLTAGLTAGSGELVWNSTDATLDLGLPGGSTLQVGQEFLVRGRNTSGTTMVDGTVVYVSGALGARAVFSRAQANQSTADKTIGVITQDLSNNSDGFCTLAGLVRNFDTSGWAEGVELWLSAATAGALTDTKPAPPNNAVRVGQVIRSHATQGQILVRVQIIEALRELHDVNVTAPADGDILVYDSTTQTWLNEPNTGGTGEVNTASNLGAGTGLFAGKVGADLQFKSLVEGTGVTITSDATTVTINASGAGGAVDSVNGETGVVVLTTTDIAEGTNLYYTNARASAAAPVQSVDGQTGAVSLSSAYAPLSHIGDSGAAHANAVASGAAGFMTGADKSKLDGVAAGATANPNTDSLSEGSTNLYFTAVRVLATLMSGFTLVAGGTVLAADSLLVAIGKLQSQINALVSGKQDTLVSATNIKTINGSSLLGSGDLTVSGGVSLPVVQALTSSRALVLADVNTFNVNSTTSNYEVTIGPQSAVTWTDDAEIHFLPSSTGDIVITGGSGVSVNGVVAGSVTLSTAYGAVSIKRIASDEWWVGGAFVGNLEASSINGGQLGGLRNKIINGNPLINQRGVSGTVTLAAGAYGHDRWKAGASGCTYTFATSNNVTTLTISAGSLQQVIEGNNLQTGTYTLSWTGTAQGKIGAGSYSAAGVTRSIVGGTNTTVEFNTGTVSLVQLEFGSTASAFEHRPYGQELALCQRYYWRGLPLGAFNFSSFTAGSYTSYPIAFPHVMRVIPTTGMDLSGSSFASSGGAGFGFPTTSGARFIIQGTEVNVNCTVVFGSGSFFFADAEL